MSKEPRRYRLTVRTEPSQGLNTGSIPVSATNLPKIKYLELHVPRRESRWNSRRHNEKQENSKLPFLERFGRIVHEHRIVHDCVHCAQLSSARSTPLATGYKTLMWIGLASAGNIQISGRATALP